MIRLTEKYANAITMRSGHGNYPKAARKSTNDHDVFEDSKPVTIGKHNKPLPAEAANGGVLQD